MKPDLQTASEIAAAVSSRRIPAAQVVDATLARIASVDPKLNSFTDVVADRAKQRAHKIDQAIASGLDIGPLAGVPFAVKNLFDVAGLADTRGLEDQPRSCAGGA